MTETSTPTSLVGLFGDGDNPITEIEIPLFQRDYAQGRDTAAVTDIRTTFLDVLHGAVAGTDPTPVGLDFVYGELDANTLRPLDGQQRLTTLFLLHWYVASRAGVLDDGDHPWKQFSYATRPSARLFCQRLVATPLATTDQGPSKWICDQPWYLYVWRHDPTIQSMLVMIDAIHARFAEMDHAAVWARLVDADKPAISFLLLSLPEMGSVEELYIKMNSRGKPLTEFETFKAHFEKVLATAHRADEFALKVDTTWSDLLWEMRGDDDLIDDEFMRYLEFVLEICEWREGRTDGPRRRLETRAVALFGDDNPRRPGHIEFLFDAFDVWTRHTISDVFENLFIAGETPDDSQRVRLFFRGETATLANVNLFDACCRTFGASRGRARVFSYGQSLVLYAVVLHLIEDTPDFGRRVRRLRNLIEASTDEIRPDKLPQILDDVHAVIRDGDLDGVSALNTAQTADEIRKQAILAEHPGLEASMFRLEDHELLRGSLPSFDLDPERFESRAATFATLMDEPDLWTQLTGALLAVGEYQRRRTNSRPFLFGTNSKKHDNAWRELLTGASLERLGATRQVLMTLLDAVADRGDQDLTGVLDEIIDSFLAEQETLGWFDWRYYLVKYPEMRERGSSTYFAERFDGQDKAAMGYSLCMLKGGGRIMSGNYRDPFLLALWRAVDEDDRIEDPWFTGYEENPRWLRFTRSGVGLRCVPAGFTLADPPDDDDLATYGAVLDDLGVGEDRLVAIAQTDVDGSLLDTEDRIERGSLVVTKLLEAGL